MMERWSPAQQRLLAVGILLALMALLALLVVGPIVARYQAYQARIESLETRVARFRDTAAERPALRARLEALGESQEADYYLAQTRPALASAALQQRIKTLVTAAGGRLLSVQSEASEGEATPGSVRIRVQMEGDMETLQEVLYAVGTGKPLLFIDRLEVRAPGARTGDAAGAGPLQIGFAVTGYLKGHA